MKETAETHAMNTGHTVIASITYTPPDITGDDASLHIAWHCAALECTSHGIDDFQERGGEMVPR